MNLAQQIGTALAIWCVASVPASIIVARFIRPIDRWADFKSRKRTPADNAEPGEALTVEDLERLYVGEHYHSGADTI